MYIARAYNNDDETAGRGARSNGLLPDKLGRDIPVHKSVDVSSSLAHRHRRPDIA